MLTSEAVARELPRLRRYARALTGSQESGDAYVGTTLEALAEDPASLTGEDGMVVANRNRDAQLLRTEWSGEFLPHLYCTNPGHGCATLTTRYVGEAAPTI